MVTAMTGSPKRPVLVEAPNAKPQPQAYRIADACHVLGIGRTSLYELVSAGQLKLIRISGRSLVPRSEIERLTSVERD